jgi:hypothetical protein
MRKLSTTFLFAAVLLSQPGASYGALADESRLLQICIGPDRLVAQLQKSYPQMGLALLSGDDASQFMALYNAQPPATNWRVDEVLITRSPESPELAQLGFFRDGCLVMRMVVRRWALDALVSRLGQDV